MIKKLLALVLSLMLVLSFAGCSSDTANEEKDEKEKVEEKADKKEKKEEKEKTPEEEAEAVAEAFMDAYIDFDSATLVKLVNDADELPEIFQQDILDQLVEEASAELPGYEEDFKEVFEVMFNSIKKELSYEIIDVEEDEDKFTFTVSTSTPDFDNISFDDYFSDEAMSNLLSEMLANGEITEDMSEEELMDTVMTAYFDMAKEVFTEIDFGTAIVETECKVVVVKDGKKWVVDAANSELDSI